MTLIQTKGWCQGEYENKNGQVCASMAIQNAGQDTRYSKAMHYFCTAVGAPVVPLWNDSLATTYEDVILGFKHAAELAEKAGD